jgi:molecular chaperone HscB
MGPADDDFALLGLPRRFAIDPAEVDARWRALQDRVHPDRLASEGPAARQAALQWSLRVNEARTRLKSPLRRGELLCALRGAPAAPGRAAVPAGLLQRQMAWREALDEANGLSAVRRIDDEVAAHESALVERLRLLLDEHDDAPAAAETVQALMFVSRLREDIEGRLEALEP